MVNIPNKERYRQDSVRKDLRLTFWDHAFPVIEKEYVIAESLKIDEILCSSDSLHFGECNASVLTLNVANIDSGYIGDRFFAAMYVDGEEVLLGEYYVTDVKNVEGKPYKQITGTSVIEKLNVDITDFYDSLTFPITLKDLRDAIFSHVGLSQEVVSLPFDNYKITKNWIGNNVNAKQIIEGICEINGRFGRIGRNRLEFQYVSIQNSETLNANGIMKKNVISDDFVTNDFDGIIVTDDYGTSYKSSDEIENPYILNNNVLLYGLGKEELHYIITNMLPYIQGCTYVPIVSCVIKGQPYAEVGDKIMFGNKTSYILKRTLSGIQSLTDTITASGTEYSKYDKNTMSNQLSNLNRSTGRLKIDMSATQDGVQIAVSKAEEALIKAESLESPDVGGVNLVDNSYLFGCVTLSNAEVITDSELDKLRDENKNILFEY